MSPFRRDKNRAHQQSSHPQQPNSSTSRQQKVDSVSNASTTTSSNESTATATQLTTMVAVRNLQLVTVAMLIVILLHSVLLDYGQILHNEQEVLGDETAMDIVRAVDQTALSEITTTFHESSLVRTSASKSMDGIVDDTKVLVSDLDTTNDNPYRFEQFFETAPSCHDELEPDDVDFTLVLISSLDRLWLMQHHCARWNTGKISLAVYVGYSTKSALSADAIRDLLVHDYQCQHSLDSLSIVTISGYTDKTFPTNALRNAALRAVTTSHVVSLDMDFWVPQNAHAHLVHHFSHHVAFNPKLALVLPAFELKSEHCPENGNSTVECQDFNVALMPKDKAELLRLWNNRRDKSQPRADVFHASCQLCHGSTRYTEWLDDQADDVLLPIDCVTSAGYEPYLAFRYCRQLPPFQEAFTGYGRNKHAWMVQTRRSGYQYAQVGGLFVVHFPHAYSKARRHFYDDWKRYRQIDVIFEHFNAWLNETIPDETVTPVCG
jgi:Glycosyl-transferase for dystroglycan